MGSAHKLGVDEWLVSASIDIHKKFYGDLSRGTPPPWELKTRGCSKI